MRLIVGTFNQGLNCSYKPTSKGLENLVMCQRHARTLKQVISKFAKGGKVEISIGGRSNCKSVTIYFYIFEENVRTFLQRSKASKMMPMDFLVIFIHYGRLKNHLGTSWNPSKE